MIRPYLVKMFFLWWCYPLLMAILKLLLETRFLYRNFDLRIWNDSILFIIHFFLKRYVSFQHINNESCYLAHDDTYTWAKSKHVLLLKRPTSISTPSTGAYQWFVSVVHMINWHSIVREKVKILLILGL